MTRPTSSPIHVFESIDPAILPDDVQDFLEWLGGPALFRVAGRDRSRTRVVTGLLHGNEPSGAIAIHRWLQSGIEPAVDALCFVGAVEAALAQPRFSSRMLAGHRDLNRIFTAPYEGPDGAVAEGLLAQLETIRCEALIDLHNNSGANPHFAITTRLDSSRVGLASLFTSRCVHADVRLGTLIEAVEALCPAAVIECGRCGDPAADELAFTGMAAFLAAGQLPRDKDVTVYQRMIRVELAPDLELAIGDGPGAAPVVLRADLERFNFETIAAGTPIAWLGSGVERALIATDGAGTELTSTYFEIGGGALRLREPVTPIMATTNLESARADCLCYFVEVAG